MVKDGKVIIYLISAKADFSFFHFFFPLSFLFHISLSSFVGSFSLFRLCLLFKASPINHPLLAMNRRP